MTFIPSVRRAQTLQDIFTNVLGTSNQTSQAVSTTQMIISILIGDPEPVSPTEKLTLIPNTGGAWEDNTSANQFWL